MPESIDEAVIEKYLKVMALADRGEGGEKDSAKKMLAKIEAQNPGIRAAVDAYLRKKVQQQQAQNQQQQAQSQPQPPPQQQRASNPHAHSHQQQQQQQQSHQRQQQSRGFPFGGNWEQIFEYANAFWGTAQNFAQNMSDTAEAIELADEVELSTKLTPANNVIISFRMPAEILEYAMAMSPVQQAAFRQRLMTMLNDEFDAIFSPDDTDAGNPEVHGTRSYWDDPQ
jgi:hypothetical protein